MKKVFLLGIFIGCIVAGICIFAPKNNQESATSAPAVMTPAEGIDLKSGETDPAKEKQNLISEIYNQDIAIAITMYAAKDCSVLGKPSEEGDVLTNLKKGDTISVSEIGDWTKVELDDGKEGYVKRDDLTDTMPEAEEESASTKNETPGESASKNQESSSGNEGGSQSQPAPAQKQPTSGESASTQPAPTPQPQPTPESTPQPQPNSGAANPNLTAEDIDRILGGAGATFGDVTGEVTEYHINPNAAAEAGIDISGVTVH